MKDSGNELTKIRIIAVVAAFLFPVTTAVAEPDISATDAFEAARAGRLILVDIRTPEEWRQTGVAPGALRVNFYDPQGPQGFAAKLLEAMDGDKTAPIGLICRVGNRTTRAQKYLQELGFMQVLNVREGMLGSAAGPGWLTRGLPVESCERC